MSLSFVLWAFYEFDKQYFAICGKTISSLKRNLIAPLIPMLNSLSFSCEYKASKNILTVRKKDRVNYFYLFGGKDESSSALIQGITLAGILPVSYTHLDVYKRQCLCLVPLYRILRLTVRYCSSRLMSCQVRPQTSPIRKPA